MGLFPRKDIIRIDIPKDIGEEFTDLSSGGGEIGSLIAQALRDWLDEKERRDRGNSRSDRRDVW